MELERKIAKDIWRAKREVYDRANLSNTRLRWRDESRGKYVRFCYRWSVINEVWEWEVEDSYLYFEIVEWNYEIYNKEILVIIWYLEAWRHFLEGAKSCFEIWTNHKNLEYFMKAQKLNQRQTK